MKSALPTTIILAVIIMVANLSPAAETKQAIQWNFDKEQTGKPPTGAIVFGGNWIVREESDAPSIPKALCQTGKAEYPSLALTDKDYSDATVSMRFKTISGNTDRAAGIIFRIQDKHNFYILRANALEDNVNLYKYVGGQRQVIQESSAKVTSGLWQELRVEVHGNQIRGFLDGKKIVEATDDTFKTGKIGLWTKADSIACFDDVRLIY